MLSRQDDERFYNESCPCVEIIRESRPRAKFHHICDCCGGNILRGEIHLYFVCSDEDGKFFTSRQHTACPPDA